MKLNSLLGGIGKALASRQFRRYWTANAIATIGRWIYRTAVGWMVTRWCWGSVPGQENS